MENNPNVETTNQRETFYSWTLQTLIELRILRTNARPRLPWVSTKPCNFGKRYIDLLAKKHISSWM